MRVSVDSQKNTISLNGKDGVLIMINGKVSHQPMDAIIQMLKGMNANNIQRFELISSPPSQVDAAGNGGIVNIVLLNNKKYGLNCTYGLTTGYDSNEKTGSHACINYWNKKVSAYADFSYYRVHTDEQFSNDRTVNFASDIKKKIYCNLSKSW